MRKAGGKPTRALMQARLGAVSSPHYLASLAGLDLLKQGAHAVEAAIAVNATLGVVYPHMTGMGGDAFWLIYDSGSGRLHALNGSGRAVGNASRDLYGKLGLSSIPERGALSAITVPGAVDSWVMAHERFGRLPLRSALAPAIEYARDGFPVSLGQSQFSEDRLEILLKHESTRTAFLPNGSAPRMGDIMRFPDLAETIEAVANEGRAGFYEGAVAGEIVLAVQAEGGCWEASDLREHRGNWCEPISTTYRGLQVCQHPPNSQGFVHLMLLNVLEQFDLTGLSDTSADYIGLLVEACKIIFEDRDRYLTDPGFAPVPLEGLLSQAYAADIAKQIRSGRTSDRPSAPMGGDTTCTVVVDADGNAVSVIQSLYHEFGSALVAGRTGVLLQNRGSFFSLDEGHVNRLEPGKRCFHTLMPGMVLRDGKPYLVYGTMGGEGQPQTSTMLVSRVVDYGMDVQTAIDRPRWLYGRTWGQDTKSLRLEGRFDSQVIQELSRRGHLVGVVSDCSELMGHAAAIECNPETGVFSGAADARGEGIAVGW